MKKFSLIVPVYRQEKVIQRDLEEVVTALSELTVPFEVIAVVDGQLDRSLQEAKKIKDPRVKVVGYKTNRGKGYAVRYGFSYATGDVIGFKDAGPDLKASVLPLMIAQFEFQKADVVLGSKRHPDSRVVYPVTRKILSWGYQQLVRLLFGLNVTDTQVGMKLYRRKVLEDVLPRLLVKQFAFDIEMLAVIYHLGYRKIYEAPVEIDLFKGKSSIEVGKLLPVVHTMLHDTLAVFYRLRILHYYDDAAKRKWRFDPELNFKINIG